MQLADLISVSVEIHITWTFKKNYQSHENMIVKKLVAFLFTHPCVTHVIQQQQYVTGGKCVWGEWTILHRNNSHTQKYTHTNTHRDASLISEKNAYNTHTHTHIHKYIRECNRAVQRLISLDRKIKTLWKGNKLRSYSLEAFVEKQTYLVASLILFISINQKMHRYF